MDESTVLLSMMKRLENRTVSLDFGFKQKKQGWEFFIECDALDIRYQYEWEKIDAFTVVQINFNLENKFVLYINYEQLREKVIPNFPKSSL